MAELDQLNVATERYIQDNPALVDNFFQNDPLLAYLKLNVREDFTGGTLIQEGFVYGVLPGGGYGKGKEFNITEKQIEQSIQLVPRLFEVNVTMSLEDIKVFNKGPQAAFKLIDSRMTGAYMSLGAYVAIGQYLNGQSAGYTFNLNGLAEAINDGTTNSFDTATYTTYGGITRNGAVGAALNSVPLNVGGAIEYNQLEETYGDASFGNIEANLGVTTVKGYSYVKEKFQTQQRFNDTQDPAIGFNGMKFNSATLIKSRYCPGSDIATANTQSNVAAVAYLTETSNGAVTAYPTITTGETLWWINARKPYIRFYISDDPLFGFGFTGFKPAQGNTKVCGQVLLAANIVVPGPRYHKQLYGITG